MAAYGAEAILKRELAAEGLDSRHRMLALSYLSAPIRLSFYQAEEIALLRVASRYGHKNFDRLVERHWQKYFWIGNSYGAVRVLPRSYFLGRIRQLIKNARVSPRYIKEIYSHVDVAKRNHRQALSWMKRPTRIKKISDRLVDCIWWQDQRKGYIFRYLHFIDLFVREFARRRGVPSGLYHMAWHREIAVRPNAQLLRTLRRRRQLYVCIFNKRGFREASASAARSFFKKHWEPTVPRGTKSFGGMVVFPSPQPIIGRAYIIRHHGDVARFPSGRIMVTTMTAPEYVTAIRKARAIIADEGGLTCHAAIVSRELKVPCIVGSKVATKVLRNGDVVEVDANEGIVRKLNH